MLVAAQEAIRAGRIEQGRREHAAENDTEEAADTVDAPHVERVVPFQLVLQRHGIKTNSTSHDSDQTSRGRRNITGCRRDRCQSSDRAG